MFEHLFDIHRNETCLVVGNGPGLKDVPTSFLEQHVTIGCNRVYLKHIPTYYVVINSLVIEQFRAEIDSMDVAKFAREGSGLADAYPLHLIETPMFSYSPTEWVYDGHNTTFVSLQLAFFLGFTKVILVGVDHDYDFEGKPNQELLMEGDDPNHFSGEYFKGFRWHAPDLEVSEEAYMMAKEAYEKNNRRIVNMTKGSKLKVFEFEAPQWVL